MAMAAALVATPMTPSAFAAACSAPRHAVPQQHLGGRAIAAALDRSSFSSSSSSCCRSASPDSASSASSGLSPSSGSRDGGAAARFVSTSRSSASSRRNNNAADRLGLGWRACTGGMVRLDCSGFSAASAAGRRANSAAPASAPRSLPLRIAAENPDLTNVAGTLLRLGKQGLEAGTKLVPESVPRPVAQAGVGVAGVLLASFLLKSLFSTVTFILAIGALSYAGYFFLTKGDSSSSSGKGGNGSSDKPQSTDEALEEARRIMEKYK